ncbi:MAG: hypothetical protein ACR2M4_03835 [Actinomycetota bacterium]
MPKASKGRDLKAEFLELAKTDHRVADVLLIENQNFDSTRFLLTTLLTSFVY